MFLRIIMSILLKCVPLNNYVRSCKTCYIEQFCPLKSLDDFMWPSAIITGVVRVRPGGVAILPCVTFTEDDHRHSNVIDWRHEDMEEPLLVKYRSDMALHVNLGSHHVRSNKVRCKYSNSETFTRFTCNGFLYLPMALRSYRLH